MSWLRIRHETTYVYREPVEFGRHRLVLRPREGHDVRVESMVLTIRPAHELTWQRDIFGNSVAVVDFLEPATALAIRNEVLVWRTPPASSRPAPASETVWPVVYDPLEQGVVNAYLQPVYPDEQTAVRAWVDALPVTPAAGSTGSAEAVAGRLCERIFREIRYARREEKGVLTPAQTIAGRRGSCRDMATLLLEAVRACGLAARFASGYLECSAAEAGHASTHAWTEVYLPGDGWRGYDPTSGRRTTVQHVVAGVSNHPRGVMPVSGLFFGQRASFKEMKVTVHMDRPLTAPPVAPEVFREAMTPGAAL